MTLPMQLRYYLKKHPVLKQSILAEAIDWNPTSFSEWMNENRPIPDEKAEALKKVLSKYGFHHKYDDGKHIYDFFFDSQLNDMEAPATGNSLHLVLSCNASSKTMKLEVTDNREGFSDKPCPFLFLDYPEVLHLRDALDHVIEEMQRY